MPSTPKTTNGPRHSSKGPKSMFHNLFGGKKEGTSTDEDSCTIQEQPLLVEIVSCQDLLAADKTGKSDPYVTVQLGKKQVHKTSHLEQTLNPVYGLKDKNSFVLKVSPSEVAQHKKGLVFHVKDYDGMFDRDDPLGSISISAKELFANEYDANGKTTRSFPLKPPKNHKHEHAGTITVQWRPATPDDIQRLEHASKRFPNKMMGFLSKHTHNNSAYGAPDLHFLMDIVACYGLPAADFATGTSDPYVKVKLGDRDVHETKYISKTCDPIFTIKYDSLFLLDVHSQELQEHDGLLFKVKDYDAVGLKNDDLCSVKLTAQQLLQQPSTAGERLELELITKRGKPAGRLVVRFRLATDYDRTFLQHCSGNLDHSDRDDSALLGLAGMDKAMTQAGGQSRIRALFKKTTQEQNGVTKLRVRPYPDPEQVARTEFLSEQEIQAQAMQPSKRWLELGTGDLGRLFVEIIGCDGLPNKENDIARTGDKSDPFVTVVYEDGVAKTDIIDDCLSPRWLPWMQRAFIFRMIHPSSNLYLGAFDFDAGASNNHDICGHVFVDLANLRPDTEYLLHYNLYEDSMTENAEAKGTITVRLRMELNVTQKEVVLTNLAKPPEIYVNVKKQKDFRAIRQTVGGKRDFDAYNKEAIGLYQDELWAYLDLKYYAFEAALSLFLWRGQVPFFGFHLPLHSLVAFLAMITVVETPSLAPTYFWYGIGWILLASQTYRNKHPSPWAKSKSFMEIAMILAGKASGPATIAENQDETAATTYQGEHDAWWNKNKTHAQKVAEYNEKMMQEHADVFQAEQVADTDISTKTGGVSLDPLKPILYPIQQYLAMAVKALRLVQNVFTWEEPYLAFFLTVGSFLLGTVFLITPWVFLLRWLSRLVAWGLFGPHMKLVDIYWYSKQPELSEEALDASIKNDFLAQLAGMKEVTDAARVQREQTTKLKAMKKVLFGKFITHIPVIRTERFSHHPLASSSGKPYEPSLGMRAVPERIVGQQLTTGDMIPAIAENDDLDTEETEYEDALGFSHKFKDD